MTAVLGSTDSHLFELRNFHTNESLYRKRHSTKTNRPSKASPPGRPPREGGSTGDTLATVSPSGRSTGRSPTLLGIVKTPPSKPSSATTTATAPLGGPTALIVPTAAVDSENQERALALRVPLRGGEDGETGPTAQTNGAGEVRVGTVGSMEPIVDSGGRHESLDEVLMKRVAKMVVREMHGVKRTKETPIRLDDFTGEKSPYLAEDAIVWLKKVRLAARLYEWDHELALEVAAVHLKGLAARWFASIERHLNEELHLDRDRWNYFQSQFEERFADFRSRLTQIEKIKELRLRHGEDIREYAEAIMSMNCRLDEPLDDELLRWVFIQGLPPSELREKLCQFEEGPHTMANAVKYARRFQLSQSVFKTPSSPTPGRSPGSTSARSVKSN